LAGCSQHEAGSVAAHDGERPDTEHRVLDADDRATFESALDLLPALHEPAMQDARLSITETEDDDGWGVVAREREQVAVVQVVREDDLAVSARFVDDRLVRSAPEADVRGVPARVPLGE